MTPDDPSLSPGQAVALVLSWAAYAAIHSALAALGVKRWVARRWPGAMPAYRLGFNLLAVLLLIPPLWLTFAWSGPALWRWSGPWAWLADGLALGAVAGFVWSLRYYDTRIFSGTAQWRAGDAGVEEREPLSLSPLHRYVRHPWYALALVILWTRDMDLARLLGTVCVSLYFWLGSLLEERKLLQFHGEAYARYRRRVPGLIPLPGRVLSKAEARDLVAASAAGQRGRVS